MFAVDRNMVLVAEGGNAISTGGTVPCPDLGRGRQIPGDDLLGATAKPATFLPNMMPKVFKSPRLSVSES